MPGATAVTKPLPDTVAMPAFDDVHVAELVTSSVELLASVAVAVSCDVVPTVGVLPVTLIADTLLGDVDEPHAAIAAVRMAKSRSSTVRIARRVCCDIHQPRPICKRWLYTIDPADVTEVLRKCETCATREIFTFRKRALYPGRYRDRCGVR